VIVDNKTIFVGLSLRTNIGAIKDLQLALRGFEIITLSFHERYLHLDCVFNIISNDTAIYFEEAFDSKEIEKLKSKYTLISVSNNEQLNLATNVISVGNRTVISLPENKHLNQEII